MRTHSRFLRVAAGAAAALLFTACADDATAPVPGDPSLVDGTLRAEVLAVSPRAGAQVDVRFVNTSDLRYGLNACSRTAERLVDGAWIAQPAELRICAALMQFVDARGSATYSTDVPVDAVAGTYRFVFALSADLPASDTRPVVTLRSEPFAIQ